MRFLRAFCVVSILFCAPVSVLADIITSSDTHYVLRHQVASEYSAEELWQRLIKPSTWWHPDHTYSGDAKNLSLDLTAGGLWKEEWSDGSVEHGRVMLVQAGKVLRMEAPFGPLQGVGAYVVWTITVTPAKEGAMVIFDETATGPKGAGLENLAQAVDGVKEQAIQRLIGK
ncbi:MAG: hypothetical protein AB8G18_16925 [Gammaproteobacteria bacterium]